MTKNTMVEATLSDIPIRGACRVIPVGAGGPEKRDFWLKNAITTSRPGFSKKNPTAYRSENRGKNQFDWPFKCSRSRIVPRMGCDEAAVR
jgi:hypothetical protein